MKESVREALHEMGRLLRDHPTTGALARDKNGRELHLTTADSACSWCLVGALDYVYWKVSGPFTFNELRNAVDKVVFVGGDYGRDFISTWEGPNTSDETRHAIAEKLLNA